MMMNPCYPNETQNGLIYGVSEEVVIGANSSSSSPSSHPSSFLYDLSILKDKVHQVQSLASIFMSPEHGYDHHPESIAVAVPTVATLIQEIILTASSMMFACHQMSLRPSKNNNVDVKLAGVDVREPPPPPQATLFAVDHWFGDQSYNSGSNTNKKQVPRKIESNDGGAEEKEYDVVELEAADLLAKYTHYCHVCGKGFKRDANLRMHMRAHGDEYKSSAALSNPARSKGSPAEPPRKYSCPAEGWRWNKRHARFTPLKSMICVKNHYKWSHCPKMYVCKRCSRKQFSVLSDLRTHEKHCGDLKWQCTCGTTFSRKDKLMGHVTLFVGHAPAGK